VKDLSANSQAKSRSPGHSSAQSNRNIVVRASAGTGKTFRLSNHYIRLLRSGVAADQILATTFTRKAAGEILERILIRLAAASGNNKKCAELADFIDDPSLNRKCCLEMLQHLTQNLHRLHICTLDSFFAQIAGSFSLELGLPPGWQIVDELTDSRLRTRAIEMILRNDTTSNIVRLMSLLTKGTADRSVSDLVRSTVDKLYHIYQQTNVQAWQKIPHPKQLSETELTVLQQELQNLSVPAHKTIQKSHRTACQNILEADWESFISKGIGDKILDGETTFCRKPIEPLVYDLYERVLQHAKAVLLNQLARQTEAAFELLSKFDDVYRELKHDARAMRFDDIAWRLAEVATFHNGPRLTFRLDSHIAHLLLDEFQDTSLTQWRIVRPLAEQVTSGGENRSFFCVGDAKQAIYSWRGGVAEIFDTLNWQLTDLDEESLTHSFRSAQPVIDVVNTIFTRIPTHSGLKDLAEPVRNWCRNFEMHTTDREKLVGYVCLVTAPQAGRDEKQFDVTIRFAAKRIADIVRQAPGHSVGVLTQRNITVGKLIFELHRLGIPASEEGGNPVTDSAAVQVIISQLRIADHPGDTVARFHLANSPLGPIVGFTDYQNDGAAIRLAQHVRKSLLTEGYGVTLYRWVQQLAPSCSRHDLARLTKLLELAYVFQPKATLRASDFLHFVQTEKIANPTSHDVRVMTIYQAKGLQFDVVVLPELDSGLSDHLEPFVISQPDPTQPIDKVCIRRNDKIKRLLPDDLQKMFERAIHQSVNESLCVLYVAVTRAVHALHMIIAPSQPNERQLQKTDAALLRAALTDSSPVSPQTTVFEHGDEQWFKCSGSTPVDARPSDVENTKPIRAFLAPATGSRRRGLERVAPSSLEGGSKVKLTHVFDNGNAVAFEYGTLMHAWFEQIEWLDDGRPDENTLRHVAATIGAVESDIDQMLAQFDKFLDCPQIARVLSRAAYQTPSDFSLLTDALDRLSVGPVSVEVYNERRFAIRESNRLLSGSIDRLVLMYQGKNRVAADILDFKTDDIPAADSNKLAARVEYYRGQLEAYQRAVANVYSIPRECISARLVFVFPGVVRNI